MTELPENILYNRSEFDLEKPNRKLSKLCDNIKIDYLDLLPILKKKYLKVRSFISCVMAIGMLTVTVLWQKKYTKM